MSSEPQVPPPAPASPAETATAGGPAQRGQDVIHNIGYRNYDGPRLGRGYARRSLFVHSLRGCYGLGRSAKSKVLPMILLGVMCLPAAMMVAIVVQTHIQRLPVESSSYVIQLQPVIGIFVAAAAPQAASLDLRFGVVPLYFSRPIERGDYVSAKLAALFTALFVFTSLPLAILYSGALLAKLDFVEQTRDFALGLVCNALFSLLHAGIALLLAALTPRRGFGVAAIIAVLTVPYILMTGLQEIANGQDIASAVGWIGLGSPGSLIDGLQGAFLDGTVAFPGGHDPTTAQASVYVLVFAALLAGAYALLLRRYRKAGL